MQYLVGNEELLYKACSVPAREPFCDEITGFLSELSRNILSDKRSRQFPDVTTFAFWIRKAALAEMKKQYITDENLIRLGRGLAFHIAPSNVPVNFAYSLTAGLLTGNANVVRVPTKKFEQVQIISEAIDKTLSELEMASLAPYIILVSYGHEKEENDRLSAMSDIRIVWGGDQTISEIRNSGLGPRSTEITFADRYSVAVIDSDVYLERDSKRTAEDFYNDTYLTDQNACTSPRVVIWTGNQKEKAKELFWSNLHTLVKTKYLFQSIQGINKLENADILAVKKNGVRIINSGDNLIIRAKLSEIGDDIPNYFENSGFFIEYDCDDFSELIPLLNNVKCQTIGMIGDEKKLIPVLKSGIKGVDRVVPIGKTMDFELIWDGYELMSRLTRVIKINNCL